MHLKKTILDFFENPAIFCLQKTHLKWHRQVENKKYRKKYSNTKQKKANNNIKHNGI